jgi:hypothetical protein
MYTNYFVFMHALQCRELSAPASKSEWQGPTLAKLTVIPKMLRMANAANSIIRWLVAAKHRPKPTNSC